MDFTTNLSYTVQAMAELLIMSAIGYIAVKKRLLEASANDILSKFLIDIALPLFIFTKLIQDFKFSTFTWWWAFPLLSVVITAAGFLVGRFLLLFNRHLAHKNEFAGIVTFQNSGYLPLALVASLFTGERASTLYVYIFLFLIGFNAVMFSWGAALLSGKKDTRLLQNAVTPPFVATLAALILIFLRVETFIPSCVIRPLYFIGSCTIPLGMITLGGILAESPIRKNLSKRIELQLIIGKLIILPLIALGAIAVFKVPKLLGFLVLMQAAMPPATTLSILAKRYGANFNFISRSIFIGHIASLITIPLWLLVFEYFF